MPKRRPLVAGNWKMNLSRAGCRGLAAALRTRLASLERVQTAVFPAFPYLVDVAEVLEGSAIALGAQDLAVQDEGAYTGEVSGGMLRDVRCRLVLVGHSERRYSMGENDTLVAAKLRAALRAGLTPVLCVGETLAERERGETFQVLERQLGTATEGLSARELDGLVVAYEPVWAIGTGVHASPGQAAEAHAFVREVVSQRVSRELADALRILYGGSVKASNARELLASDEVDGALVGGASLTVEAFAPIVEAAIAN
ncbi:MAG: triose-phosphate isomerase [Planctomycetota bacterium]